MFKKSTYVFLFCLFFSLISFSGELTKNVILFIGDGMGMSTIDASRIALFGKDGSFEFEKAPYIGIQKNYSLNSLVTDSAAAGTALATGYKTNNSMISILPDGKNLKTLVEAAKEKNKSAGIITTVTITHATPAVFGAHTPSRDELPVADEFAKYKSADVYLGGGQVFFTPKSTEGSKRTDERNLIEEFRSDGYDFADTPEKLEASNSKKLLGLFSPEHLPYFIEREYLRANVPSLAQMTKKALNILSANKNGFFVMIEGGKIDWSNHGHDLATTIREMEEFNLAVKEGIDFLKTNPDTVIIVTADHETGGIGLSTGDYVITPEKLLKQKISAIEMVKLIEGKTEEEVREVLKIYAGIDKISKKDLGKIMKATEPVDLGTLLTNRADIGYTTTSHTGQSIPVYAFGKNGDKFSGVYENTEIAKKIANVSGLELTK